MRLFLEKFPPSLERAVETLAATLSFADKTRLANMDPAALIRFHDGYGVFVRNEFRLPGNAPLMHACAVAAGLEAITAQQASYLIVKRLQRRLQTENTLKVVK